jgi:hypothetical protein
MFGFEKVEVVATATPSKTAGEAMIHMSTFTRLCMSYGAEIARTGGSGGRMVIRLQARKAEKFLTHARRAGVIQ